MADPSYVLDSHRARVPSPLTGHESSLYSKTRHCMPESMHELKPNALAVAILKPDQKVEGPKSEGQYLWVKCASKTTAVKILQQCKLRLAPSSDELVLKHGPRIVDPHTPMSELVDVRDHLVVLEVFTEPELSSRMLADRQPLRPTHHHQANQIIKTETPHDAEKPKLKPFNSLHGPQDENRAPILANLPLSPHSAASPLKSGEPGIRWKHYIPGANHSTVTDARQDADSNGTVPGEESLPPNESPHDAKTQHRNSLSPPVNDDHVSREVPDAAFSRYMTYGLTKARKTHPEKNEAEITALLRTQWSEGGPICRAYLAGQTGKEFVHTNADSRPPIHQQSAWHTNGRRRSPSVVSAPETEQPGFQLHTLLSDAGPEVLESSVRQGVKLLEKLKQPLESKASDSSDASQWIEQIENVRKQAVPTKTIIGVVGNTGAGKSSVINAMLDEERLVPTNCMRACTAVVTELSYNYERQPYRAEIEFIQSEDWQKELETLFHDLLDVNGTVSRDCSNEDTDAGIAYAKIKAVYPRKTKEDIANSSIGSMLQEVSHLLGSKKQFAETESLRFYNRLQHYVDSKEKVTSDKKEKDKKRKERREMEYWPLIRVVRIYVKSPALSTGAVIVDLPGVHDSNAARAAVAEGYMKQCTGLWIVAPITRAVDDRSAKVLLGESFKRQLKMDGGFNAVTFICSKTDDISLSEAQDSLDLGDELGASWDESDQLRKDVKSMKKHREELKETRMVYSELMNDADDQLDLWDKLKDELNEGKTVSAPKAKVSGKKRKMSGAQNSRKKPRIEADSDYDNSVDEDCDEETSDDVTSDDETGESLTEDQISSKISEIRGNKKKARQEKAELEGKIKALDAEIRALQAKIEVIEADIAAKCIAGRNGYSKRAIQQDFAAGIKELDQEIAAENDEETFDPSVDVRDYNQVAQSLKCFCVSSRAYQKLRGRLQKEPNVPGFQTVEETEMPQLQEHCKELTKEGRSANCRRFINNLSQLLNSLALWASSDGTSESLSVEQREREGKVLTHNLKKLENGLDGVVSSTCKDLAEDFGDNIFDRYEDAVTNAVREASLTARNWGAPVNRDNRTAGGLFWATYKAICRREGVYTNAQGPHEWNVQLSEPMMKTLAGPWERVFSRKIPMTMSGFHRKAASLIREVHNAIDSRARKIGMGIASLHGLKQQLSVYENLLKDISKEATDTVSKTAKEINREFVPVVQREMSSVYNRCMEECGPGSFARMKFAMVEHVDQQRHTMFQQSVDEVRRQLKRLLQDLEAMMNDRTDQIFISMQRDYRSVLGGGVPQGEILPKSQRLSRKEVLRLVEGVETLFRKIAGGETLQESDEDEALAEATSHPLRETEDQLSSPDALIKHEQHETDLTSKNESANTNTKEAQTIKPDAQGDQSMADVSQARDGALVEAVLSSVETVDKPAVPGEDSGEDNAGS